MSINFHAVVVCFVLVVAQWIVKFTIGTSIRCETSILALTVSNPSILH